MALVVDTGVLYAALDDKDPAHPVCSKLITEATEQLVIPSPVLVELDYWVRKHASADAWALFTEDLVAGAYTVFQIDAPLTRDCAQLQARYSDAEVGFVDAAVFLTCEALDETKVATLDRRHFGILRRSNGTSLDIMP
jgi:uncharacterized protein